VYSTMETYCGDDCMSRIVLTDLANGSEYLVDSRDANPPDPTIVSEQISYPAIYASAVYYSDGRLVDTGTERILQCEIFRLSLTTGETDVVHAFETPCEHNCWCPDELDAYDNYLVWQDNRDGMGGMQKVRLLDLTSGIETTISEWLILHPSIWGNTVIYDSYPTSLDTINRYDIDTGTTTIYTDGEHDRWNGDIWQNLITWSDARAGGTQADQAYADIYMMDFVTGVETPICTHPASQFENRVFGDLVVWDDLRNDPENPNFYPAADNVDIYGYRISTGEEMQLTDLPGKEWVMELHDNHVFFLMDDGTGVENIFMRDVPF